jgi:kynurenine formamidase
VSNADDVKTLGAKLRNWGRWGDDDELGTLNFITAEKRRAAAARVRKGEVFSLALPLDQMGPMPGVAGRTNPVRLMMQSGLDPAGMVDLGGGANYTDDFVMMPLQSSTQWDALCHVHYDGQFFNGAPLSSVDGFGAARNGIDKVHDKFVSRGVLLDVARLQGRDALEPGYAITADDLDAAEARQGVTVEEGDILLVRSGWFTTHDRTGTWDLMGGHPGLHWEATQWLYDRSIAAIATDTIMVEASGQIDDVMLPLHMIALRDMGLHLGELWYLEHLAADCALDGVSEFLLVAAALRFTGAVGSPLNPIAIK